MRALKAYYAIEGDDAEQTNGAPQGPDKVAVALSAQSLNSAMFDPEAYLERMEKCEIEDAQERLEELGEEVKSCELQLELHADSIARAFLIGQNALRGLRSELASPATDAQVRQLREAVTRIAEHDSSGNTVENERLIRLESVAARMRALQEVLNAPAAIRAHISRGETAKAVMLHERTRARASGAPSFLLDPVRIVKAELDSHVADLPFMVAWDKIGTLKECRPNLLARIRAQVFETIACDEAVPGSLESIQLPCAEEDLAFEVEDGAWKAVLTRTGNAESLPEDAAAIVQWLRRWKPWKHVSSLMMTRMKVYDAAVSVAVSRTNLAMADSPTDLESLVARAADAIEPLNSLCSSSTSRRGTLEAAVRNSMLTVAQRPPGGREIALAQVFQSLARDGADLGRVSLEEDRPRLGAAANEIIEIFVRRRAQEFSKVVRQHAASVEVSAFMAALDRDLLALDVPEGRRPRAEAWDDSADGLLSRFLARQLPVFVPVGSTRATACGAVGRSGAKALVELARGPAAGQRISAEAGALFQAVSPFVDGDAQEQIRGLCAEAVVSARARNL